MNVVVLVHTVFMTILKKVKLKKSDDQIIIDKYMVAANITEYHIIPKFIFRRIIIATKINMNKTLNDENLHTDKMKNMHK